MTNSSFALTERQEAAAAVLQGPHLYTLIYGGGRSGKTFLILYAMVARALAAPESRHLIAKQTFSQARQALMLDTFPKLMRLAQPNLDYGRNLNDQYVTLPNGSEIWFGGVGTPEEVDKCLGKEYCTVAFNECTEMAYHAVDVVRGRLAQKAFRRDGTELAPKAYHDCNPDRKSHWTYQEFEMGLMPDGTPVRDRSKYKSVLMNPDDNPHRSSSYDEVLDGMTAQNQKRFKHGIWLSADPDALWNQAMIDFAEAKPTPDLDKMNRIVVAVDPAGRSDGDKTGIVVVGSSDRDDGEPGEDYHVLADRSLNGTPEEWADEVISTHDEFGADAIVAEVNQGWSMVQSVIRSVVNECDRDRYRIVEVQATRGNGKVVRAEPVAALYEKGRVSHSEDLLSHLPPEKRKIQTDLVDQLLMLKPGMKRRRGHSPDSADAMVYGVTELSKPTIRSRPPKRVSFGGLSSPVSTLYQR